MGHLSFTTFGLIITLLSVVDITTPAGQLRYSSVVALLASCGAVFIVARYLRRGGSRVLTALEVFLCVAAVLFSLSAILGAVSHTPHRSGAENAAAV